jgi:hypothetical protein
MKKRFAPKDIIPETQREWKKRKRQEWKRVLKAAHVFLQGAAFTPADDKLKVKVPFYPDILDEMESIKRALSTKEWGR